MRESSCPSVLQEATVGAQRGFKLAGGMGGRGVGRQEQGVEVGMAGGCVQDGGPAGMRALGDSRPARLGRSRQGPILGERGRC